MTAKKIEEEILKKITPTKEEEEKINEITNELFTKIKNYISKKNIDVEPLLVGSIAKRTFLRNVDIDIFVLFPKETCRKDLEKYGLEIGRAVINGREHYAEHPYINGFYKGYEVDIVPCYKIEKIEQKMSAVDRTPFHTKYIIENINEKLIREIRLFKQFAKGIGVYGAEAEIQGFSGYLTELLVIKYGSFEKLIKNAKTWKFGKLIQLDEKDIFSNFYEPLIVIDPVDSSRNVAAALSIEKFSTFIYACNQYLKNPKIEFFFPNKIVPLTKQKIKDLIKNRQTKFIALKFSKPDLISDILIPQIRKCTQNIIKMLESFDFKLLNYSFDVNNEIIILLEFEVFKLPKIKKHFGPKIWHENSKDFLNKWNLAFIENDRFVVEVDRKYTTAFDAIKGELTNLSLGKNLNDEISKAFQIFEDDKILDELNWEFITKFLKKKFSWEY